MNGYKLFPAFLVMSILLVPVVFAALGETSITISGGSTGSNIGASTSLKANGASCSAASECTGGFCNSNVCASSAPSTISSSSSSSPSGTTSTLTTTSSAADTAATTTTTPTEVKKTEEKPAGTITTTSVNVPVTDKSVISEVIQGVKAADLGVQIVNVENIEVKKVAQGEGTTTVAATESAKVVETALSIATDESAKQALNEIKQSVSSGSSAPVSVKTSVEVFEVKEKTTGKITYSSKITLTLEPDKDLKGVTIVEVISKSVAANIADVIFLGEKPTVLQADPIVQWEFQEVKQGETKDLSYQVAKKIDTLTSNTVAVSQAAVSAPPAEIKGPNTMVIIGIIALVAIGVAAFFYFQKKR